MQNSVTIKPHFSANIDNKFNMCELNMNMLNTAIENDNTIFIKRILAIKFDRRRKIRNNFVFFFVKESQRAAVEFPAIGFISIVCTKANDKSHMADGITISPYADIEHVQLFDRNLLVPISLGIE